jgi:hypothetical protein
MSARSVAMQEMAAQVVADARAQATRAVAWTIAWGAVPTLPAPSAVHGLAR